MKSHLNDCLSKGNVVCIEFCVSPTNLEALLSDKDMSGSPSSRRRVVVTGLGMVTPLGNSVESTWEGIVAGRSGAKPISNFDASEFTTHFCAPITDLDIETYMPAREAKRMDPFIQYGVVAGIQAMEDSGL